MWKRICAVLVLVAILLAVVAVVIHRPPPPSPLPSPNGYDDFTKARGLVVDSSHKWEELDVVSLRQLVESNRPALALVRSGLEKECAVPPYSPTNTKHMDMLAGSKVLAFAFLAESRLARSEDRTNEAATALLDCFRFGSECGRGGLLIDHLVGLAVQHLALARFSKLRDGLDAPTLRLLASTLEQTDRKQEKMEVILEREYTFGGVQWRILRKLVGDDQKQRNKVMQKNQSFLLLLRNEELAHAERAFELEKGHLPASARDLVPDYLKSVPLHPGTGQPMK
jgi:hypothetical protein